MDCLFCRIVAGEIPSYQVYEDDHAYSFLDIAGWQKGHSLVVPKRHVGQFLDDPSALEEIAPAIGKVAEKLVAKLGADGVNLLTNSGEVAGQEVFHLHVHVIPRYAEKPGLDQLINRGEDFDLEQICAQLGD